MTKRKGFGMMGRLAGNAGYGRLELDQWGIPLEILRKTKELNRYSRFYGVNIKRLLAISRLFRVKNK